jgi:hypothetical protein
MLKASWEGEAVFFLFLSILDWLLMASCHREEKKPSFQALKRLRKRDFLSVREERPARVGRKRVAFGSRKRRIQFLTWVGWAAIFSQMVVRAAEKTLRTDLGQWSTVSMRVSQMASSVGRSARFSRAVRAFWVEKMELGGSAE